MNLVPCTGIHHTDKNIVCKRKERCVRCSGEEIAANKAQLIIGVNIKVLDECKFFVGELS